MLRISSFCFSLNLSHPCFWFLEIKLVVKKGDLEDLVLTRLMNFPSSSRSASRLEGLVEKLQDLKLDHKERYRTRVRVQLALDPEIRGFLMPQLNCRTHGPWGPYSASLGETTTGTCWDFAYYHSEAGHYRVPVLHAASAEATIRLIKVLLAWMKIQVPDFTTLHVWSSSRVIPPKAHRGPKSTTCGSTCIKTLCAIQYREHWYSCNSTVKYMEQKCKSPGAPHNLCLSKRGKQQSLDLGSLHPYQHDLKESLRVPLRPPGPKCDLRSPYSRKLETSRFKAYLSRPSCNLRVPQQPYGPYEMSMSGAAPTSKDDQQIFTIFSNARPKINQTPMVLLPTKRIIP
ncbi:hypothetical protein F2Q69_00035317 [Brassica cretica]|uniref:Uncharacterized protein n=1 Tax=Brassica cretica TaxID=69181 RepID=A0A8S9SQE2_BRACR|nr:hypothetical protein F2Q69_00035317 [Brassica cretica]